MERNNEVATAVVHTLEAQAWVDTLADPVQANLNGALETAGPVRDVLDGTPVIGHPLHPAITAIPIGAWTAGLVLDLLDAWGGNRTLRPGADAVQAIGLAGALGAAVTGMANWSHTDGAAKRLGFLHGMTNTVVAGLYGASLLARAQGQRSLGVGLSGTGYVLLLGSAWLGGELTYRYGVGVNRPAPPDNRRGGAENGAPVTR